MDSAIQKKQWNLLVPLEIEAFPWLRAQCSGTAALLPLKPFTGMSAVCLLSFEGAVLTGRTSEGFLQITDTEGKG